jgi:prepilin-type processing-associated H-X9-DG protein
MVLGETKNGNELHYSTSYPEKDYRLRLALPHSGKSMFAFWDGSSKTLPFGKVPDRACSFWLYNSKVDNW